MIARLLIFAVTSLFGSVCLSQQVAVRLGERPILTAETYHSDFVNGDLKSILSKLAFHRTEQASPYRNSLYEINVQGKIALDIPGLPTMPLQSLRFEKVPGYGSTQLRHAKWKLHPEDAALIVDHFKSMDPGDNYDSFSVKLNGIDCYTATLYEKPPTEDMAGVLSTARVMEVLYPRHRSLQYGNAVTSPDVQLIGDVEIAFSGLPRMQLQSLRLITTPDQPTYQLEDPDWVLHSDDVAQIVSHYEPILTQQRLDAQSGFCNDLWQEYSPTIGRLLMLAFLFWLLADIVNKRIARQQQPRRSAATQTYWWDE